MSMSTEWIAKLRGPKQWKAEDGRRVLGAWQESGESMAGFARRHGLNPQRLAWWRDHVSRSSAPPSVTFVPVTVGPTTAATSSPAVSLMVGGVVRLDVADPSRVPPPWFAAVVEALAGRAT